MKKNKLSLCSICKSDQALRLLDLDCGNIDKSALYRFAKINACKKCGHIYNELSSEEIKKLKKYYNKEYAPINISATYKTGNMPGGEGYVAFERYRHLFDFISPYITNNSRILDVGCAMGGFLDYLHGKGVTHLSGIDLIKNFTHHVHQKCQYHVKLGSAESIPFEDHSFDALIINQVIEHLVDPRRAIIEAKRVLAEDGILYLGVPDALRYGKTCSFDFYWLLMRDHLQHFDIEHLKLLAAMEGFELLDFTKNETLILSKELAMPNLNVVFRLTGKGEKLHVTPNCFKLKQEAEKYIANGISGLHKKRKTIRSLVVSKKPIYTWGIGPEFLYLYESAGLKHCDIVGLIDINPYKQKKLSVDGKKIMDKSVLKKAPSNSILIISAIAYTQQINNTLSDMGYKGKIISF